MKRIAVVLSQGQSHHPAKRQLEEEIVAQLLLERGIDVTVIPHLYDLKPDGTGVLALQGISGDMVVLSWLYSRAARWSLDRHGVQGQSGNTLLDRPLGEEEDDDADSDSAETIHKLRVLDDRPTPRRKVYCIDLRAAVRADEFVAEIRRIASEAATQVVSLDGWIAGEPSSDALERFRRPTNDTSLGEKPLVPRILAADSDAESGATVALESQLSRVDENGTRRWYPVIDFSRCTNCMECIDFCLFGVYGIDASETILVEQPDNCRKGCPACSRVCPENAIIFPQHKTPAIAGADIAVGGLKIDLSKLFGAPDGAESAADIAARERDEQLLLAGREAVGASAGLARRQPIETNRKNDELDDLLDELDELDL